MSAATNPPPIPEARALQRAEWLRAMSQQEREDLSELTLRAVDERFARWLRDAGRDPDPAA